MAISTQPFVTKGYEYLFQGGKALDTNDLETRIKALEAEIRGLKDIREIEILQRAYGYYLEHWMDEEVIDCFADSTEVVLSLYEGTWLGKEGVRRYFRRENVQPTFLHQVMQISPIIHVDPDGQTARGRWYSWGAVATPGETGIRQFFMGGIYESEYVKQHGIWRILKLKYSLHLAADPREGWVRPDKWPKQTLARAAANLISSRTFRPVAWTLCIHLDISSRFISNIQSQARPLQKKSVTTH